MFFRLFLFLKQRLSLFEEFCLVAELLVEIGSVFSSFLVQFLYFLLKSEGFFTIMGLLLSKLVIDVVDLATVVEKLVVPR